MKLTSLFRLMPRSSSRLRLLAQVSTVLAVALALTGTLISCVTVERAALVPPQIPGATFIGSKACADCHENLTKNFASATHANVSAPDAEGLEIGCESCHGPGSIHSESGGVARTIINPKRSPDVCFQCHLEKRGQFNLPSHHPLDANKLACTTCHEPHRGPALASGGTLLASGTDTCAQCHTAQMGPFVFEHEASREGCTICHEPHGTVNAKLLKDRNANACLKCHPMQQTPSGTAIIGGFPHHGPAAGVSLSRGTCWSAGCHEAVHGSQVNSSLRF